MNYQETVEYLFNVTPVFEHVGATAYKEGLDNTLALDEHFCHPHTKFKSIHIAGTNGKGSCSHTVAAMLQAAGYKVGLYTSPHLVDFRERIRVNGVCIGEEDVVDFVERQRDFFEPLHPSFFELTTAMAFKYFADNDVDYAVIEVGLGGRLDCTNIITPVLSAITNISFDHTQFLGNTLEKIASEKAGIIKRGVPVVIGETTAETRRVFERTAMLRQAPITFAEDNNEIACYTLSQHGGIDYETLHHGKIHGELGGTYQVTNANTILNIANQLQDMGVINSDDPVRMAFSNVCQATGLLGRWQLLRTKPTAICDTGHNLGGWQYLSKQIAAQPCKQLRIVFGMVDDKDIDGVMQLLPRNAAYYFTQAKSKRAIPAADVQRHGAAHCLQGQCFDTVEAAYKQAINDADSDDFVFVGGSSYIVADILSCLK